MSCASLETIAGWWLGDLTEAEQGSFEAHYFGCQRCFERAAWLQRVHEQLVNGLPPLLTAARRAALAAARPTLPAIHVEPGQEGVLQLSQRAPIGLWVMHCELGGVSRLDIEARTVTGERMFAFSDVPFDAERGEVAMPCHVHYRAFEMDPLMCTRLVSHEAGGLRVLAEYRLNHQFEETA